ncbi:hypothetical protein Tco_1505028 [Tanacetum coccineum]
MILQECESKLYVKFDRFISEPGESIHSYYLRYSKLINDMNMIKISMSNMQINMKFVNHLQPEYSRFVSTAKQARNLHLVNFDQFYVSPVVPQQPPTLPKQPDSRFIVPSFLPTDDPIASLNKAMLFLRKSQATGARIMNTVGEANTNQPRQKDFLADRLEDNDNRDDLQLHTTTNFKADHVDAYDSDCDDEATANRLYEVHHYDTYHETDVLNLNVQEMDYIEHIVSNNESYDEVTNDNDVMSYADYMVTIENDAS